MNLPRTSVVIPTLDEEDRLAACLEAVGHDPEVEIIVSDGGSRDRTREVVAAHPRARWVGGAAGRGPQLNRGAAAAAGEQLAFVHADCRLPSGWHVAVRTVLADDSVALAAFRLRTEPTVPENVGRWRSMWLRMLDLRGFAGRLPYGDQGFCLRSEVFERLGGFPDIPLMEDVALARAARRAGSIRILPLEIRTTARRVERFPVRFRLITLTFPWLFRLGVSPAWLAARYPKAR